MVSFNNDFGLLTGPCQATIDGIQVGSSSTCSFITRNLTKWLVYSINGGSSIINANSIIKIIYPALITNPLYPRSYTFGI
jgi:hypothetical protein